MSMRLQRFDFGTLRDFRGSLLPEVTEDAIMVEAPPPPPPPTFSEEEITTAAAIAKQEGYAEGYQAGLAHAAEQADRQRLAAEATIQHLSQAIAGLPLRYQHLLEQEAQELSTLVLMVAKKVTEVTLDAHAAEAVEMLVARCLPVVLSKPQLIIELHPDTFAPAMDKIEKLLQASGFEGEVQFRTNPAIGPHDAVLDWGVGRATRDTAQLWQEIEHLLATVPVSLSQAAPVLATEPASDHSIPETTPPLA